MGAAWRRPVRLAATLLAWPLRSAAVAASCNGAESFAQKVLEGVVRPGADAAAASGQLAAARERLEAAGCHGLLALLYLAGVPDARGRLEFPSGFPRNFSRALEHLALGVATPRGAADGWSFTVLGLLLSLGSKPLANTRLELSPGPEVRVAALLAPAEGGRAEGRGRRRRGEAEEPGDRAGAAYWEAAERGEPLGAAAFASLVRRGLTEVPLDWSAHRRPLLARAPEVLTAGSPPAEAAPDRACRALGTLVGPATLASQNEQPLLDKASLTWKAWRHRQRKPPGDEEWHLTKEYVDVVRHAADVGKEPQSMREMGAVHFTGHTEGNVAQSQSTAQEYWHKAAWQGDVWSAWYAALSFVTQGQATEAEPYLDIVGNASAGPLTFMAVHFKHRLGIGVPRNPEQAGLFLKASADLGNSNAQLILAHSYMGYRHGNMEGVQPPGGPSKELALVYYKAAAANGRLVPKLNAALLTAQGADPEVTDGGERCVSAYRQMAEVVYTAHPLAQLLFAHARRAYDLGDTPGARLQFALLSDAGFLYAHLNAAWLADRGREAEAAAGDPAASGLHSQAAAGDPAASGLHSQAYYYHRRAASVGHLPSMSELSARLAGGGEGVPRELRRQRLSAAFRWSTLAASRNDSRGIFDLAYMTQFGLGTERNETLARELYARLLHGGDWPARVAALSWLGLQQVRSYFLRLRESLRPAIEAAASFAAGLSAGVRTALAAAGLGGGAGGGLGGCAGGSPRRQRFGRLVFQAVP